MRFKIQMPRSREPIDDVLQSVEDHRQIACKCENGTPMWCLVSAPSLHTPAPTVPLLRVFNPVKPEKGRKLGPNFDPTFDPRKDTLSDFPTIAAAKLGGTIMDFNRLVSLQLAVCHLRCWHCYVENCLVWPCCKCPNSGTTSCKGQRKRQTYYFTINEIMHRINSQIQQERQSSHLLQHAFRLTGGEPFLAPELILQILQAIRETGLENSVYFRCETNLLSLCLVTVTAEQLPPSYHARARELITILQALGQFQNFSVHPSFHGVSETNFFANTATLLPSIDLLMSALKIFMNYNIDVYPSFGANVCDPNDFPQFFDRLKLISNNLPLRVALRRYDFNYQPVKNRVIGTSRLATVPNVFDYERSVETWDRLLYKAYHKHYGETDRWRIRL
jgi:organic radical activating enzyme